MIVFNRQSILSSKAPQRQAQQLKDVVTKTFKPVDRHKADVSDAVRSIIEFVSLWLYLSIGQHWLIQVRILCSLILCLCGNSV